MQIVVDNLITTYERAGKGKIVLLLHGWGDSSKGLRAVADKLRSQYDVVALDLPGFGGTQASDEVWGLDQYASFVESFCRKLNIRTYGILGHSNGGAIAIRGLAQGKLHANKLVLLASAGIRGEYMGRMKALRYVVKAGKIITMPLPKRYKKRLRSNVYKTVGSDMLVAEHMQETFKRVVTDDVRDDAKKLRVDTLLLYGEQDTATPPVWGRKLHECILGSTFEEIPAAGHFAHVDQPQAVLAKITGFLNA